MGRLFLFSTGFFFFCFIFKKSELYRVWPGQGQANLEVNVRTIFPGHDKSKLCAHILQLGKIYYHVKEKIVMFVNSDCTRVNSFKKAKNIKGMGVSGIEFFTGVFSGVHNHKPFG